MQEPFGIDELFRRLLARKKLILICCACGFIFSFLLSKFVVAPQYSSHVSMYVNSSPNPGSRGL